ncbi:hypothetical protein HPB51_010861 [Rhipicephalus microplus]|uniref:Uncharacterized protein n=1 Tax=Rhipicephalus microplus TaxID=6941 RepID=A0A9J6DLL2_RHIMP|nr:hypothetical protein HPB51_010861 [Rhipicephalus microplus]
MVGMKRMARKFSKAGAVVVEAAPVVGKVAAEVERVDGRIVSKAGQLESATRMGTGVVMAQVAMLTFCMAGGSRKRHNASQSRRKHVYRDDVPFMLRDDVAQAESSLHMEEPCGWASWPEFGKLSGSAVAVPRPELLKLDCVAERADFPERNHFQWPHGDTSQDLFPLLAQQV